jgi:hypothetical protein
MAVEVSVPQWQTRPQSQNTDRLDFETVTPRGQEGSRLQMIGCDEFGSVLEVVPDIDTGRHSWVNGL